VPGRAQVIFALAITMRFRIFLTAVCLAVGLGLLASACGSAKSPPSTWNVLKNPINPGQLTEMPFGTRSFWLQPWRSALVTRPATSLQNAIGVNIDNSVTRKEVGATARLLHASGFRRARLEIGWDQMSYANPSQLAIPSRWATYIAAMRTYHLRPLILLNSDPGGPVPLLAINLTLAAPAAQGARTVSLSSASAAQVVPGLTGINVKKTAARVLITAVNAGGVATLSQPLPMSLGTGAVAASTLRYAPFAPPYLSSGAPNPRFLQTLAGWLTYVKGVTRFVRHVYGSDNFDVEVWNENQDFLKEKTYFSPLPEPENLSDVKYAVLQATVNMLRDPANGLTGVKVGDGFSNQEPFTSGATVPPGTAAIDKHPYQPGGVQNYPGYPAEHTAAVGALGGHGKKGGSTFTPTFRVFMPEYYLTGIQTETLMRDLSPIQTGIAGVQHGASTHPSGSSPPAMWITEVNVDVPGAKTDGFPAADVPEMQAKAALRLLVSYASEGVQAIDLFAAKGGNTGLRLIPPAFFSALKSNPRHYPGNLGGPTMRAVHRLTSTLSGAQTIADPRQLKLDAIAQYGNASQFTGNGTAAFPTLYNRDVLAFFPFQVNRNSFVAAVYVMTSDLTHSYTSHPARGQTPYDMPPEEYRLTIGNVNAADATVSFYDPLTGSKVPATIISRTGSTIVVQLAATDSPRMLTIHG
jgi:hypothetical protein